MTNDILAIGMMSGTSVDGSVDCAALLTDGDFSVRRKCVTEYQYEKPEGLRPVHHALKAAELAFRSARGDYAAACAGYPQALRDYTAATFAVAGAPEIDSKVSEISAAFFAERDGRRRELTLNEVIARSTDVHTRAAEKLLAELGPEARNVTCVGYHGQTLYHAPFERITVQVGDPQCLADQLGIPVVFDFRSCDVAHGGQGAPLAPVYHRALARTLGVDCAAVLNLGGTANVTVVSRDVLLGFDTGPANGLLDRYVKERTGLALDFESRLASAGKVSAAALDALLQRGIILSDGRNYLDIEPPKSLDIRDYTFDVPEFSCLGIEDGCATLNAFTAECVVRGLRWLEAAGHEIPQHWILCGGGARNPHLRAQLSERLGRRAPVQVLSADEVGWSAQGMEAELMAFLAVRSIYGLPLTFPGTTGVSVPMTGGKRFEPRRKP